MTQPSAQPGRLVSAAWAAGQMAGGHARLIEVGEDAPSPCPSGSARLSPERDLWDERRGDFLAPNAFAALCTQIGVAPGSTAVIFADAGDGRAASQACWTFCHLGHARSFVLDGGWAAWNAETHPLSPAPPVERKKRPPPSRDASVRAGRRDVAAHLSAGRPLLDVRTPAEFSGVLTDAPDKPQVGIRRGGHVPGALSVPWNRARVVTGASFAGRDALRALYQDEHGLRPGDELIVYSRMAQRACYTWLVLTSVLGFERVRVYDGGWAEWGNLVGVPVAR